MFSRSSSHTFPYIEPAVDGTLERVSHLYGIIKNKLFQKRKRKFIGFVGDWGVGKDSVVLKMLGMDIPDPKVERDHPCVRRRFTGDIQNMEQDQQHYDLTVRIIPGTFSNREREEKFFHYLHRGDYDFDALAFCFASDCLVSLDSLKNKWIPKAVDALGASMPYFILVETKCDLPDDPIIEEQARLLKELVKADYCRSSAHLNIGIERLRKIILLFLSCQ